MFDSGKETRLTLSAESITNGFFMEKIVGVGLTAEAEKEIMNGSQRAGERPVSHERIRHFSAFWFTVCMATRIVSQIFHSFPYGSQSVRNVFAIAFLTLESLLFVFFSAVTVTRYVLYPEIWSRMIRHPAQSMFVGCVPIAFSTVINGVVINLPDKSSSTSIYILWSLWWIDLSLSYISCLGMMYFMITRHTQSLSTLLVTWLLIVAPLVVASLTGSIVATALIPHSPQRALWTFTISGVSLIMSLTVCFMVLSIYLMRLVMHGLPPKGVILGQFVPLGPIGQAGTAALLLANSLSKMSQHSFLPPPFLTLPGSDIIIEYLGLVIALFLWANGLFWGFLAFASFVEVFSRNKVEFVIPFWSVVFPVGDYVILSLALATTLDSSFFRIFGAITGIMILLVWGILAARTINLLMQGKAFHSPYLEDVPAGPVDLPKPVVVNVGPCRDSRHKPLPLIHDTC